MTAYSTQWLERQRYYAREAACHASMAKTCRLLGELAKAEAHERARDHCAAQALEGEP